MGCAHTATSLADHTSELVRYGSLVALRTRSTWSQCEVFFFGMPRIELGLLGPKPSVLPVYYIPKKDTSRQAYYRLLINWLRPVARSLWKNRSSIQSERPGRKRSFSVPHKLRITSKIVTREKRELNDTTTRTVYTANYQIPRRLITCSGGGVQTPEN
jgi:hypothetical protein